jgi:hypothetical protein
MNYGILKHSFRAAALFLTLALGAIPQTVKADSSTPIPYDVLKREQRSLGNVLTDGETDLQSAETRMFNNSLKLSAEDAARAASKVAHLRAMAQLHPERCARTTGQFLMAASVAQSSLTNNFFSNLKPRIVKLEDNLNNYLMRLDRLDPQMGAELRALIKAYDQAAQEIVTRNADSLGTIEYNPNSIETLAAPKLQKNKIFNSVASPQNLNKGGGGDDSNGTAPNGGGNGANGGNGGTGANGVAGGAGVGTGGNAGGGGAGNTAGGGAAGAPVTDPAGFKGTIRDSGGKILDAASFANGNTFVTTAKSDTGILTREEKTTGDLVQDGSGGAVWTAKGKKTIDWQFDIEASDTGFTLVDRSSGPADEDKGFTVEGWSVKDPSGASQDFPGSTTLKYSMSASGKYVVTAKVITNLKTHFTIFISPVNN